jgi:adenine-specific DNA-methyltransferase
VEVKIGETFNLLPTIVWMKQDKAGNGIANRSDITGLRSFFPQSERIIFAEHYGADNIAKGEASYAAKCDELRGFVFEPLRAYLAAERDRAGFTTRRVAEEYQKLTGSRTVTGMAGHWFERVQWSLPTEKNYAWLRELFNGQGGDYLRTQYDYLRTQYEDLRTQYEDLRRPFNVTADVPYTDVWTFRTVQAYEGKHVCEKPLALMEHIILASTRPGAIVFDPFMGSGSTGVAAVLNGRSFIGCEMDAKHFANASARIQKHQAQPRLLW